MNVKVFKPEEGKSAYEFEPEIGEIFNYQYGNDFTESVMLQCEEKKNGFCGGCWIKEFIEEKKIELGCLATDIADIYCCHCGTNRKDNKTVIFKEVKMM